MAWPVESVVKSDGAVLECRNALVADGDESKVGCHGTGKAQRQAGAPVVGHVFQPLEQIPPGRRYQTDQDNDPQCDESGSLFEGLEFHRRELNKKARTTQGCSGFDKAMVKLTAWTARRGHDRDLA